MLTKQQSVSMFVLVLLVFIGGQLVDAQVATCWDPSTGTQLTCGANSNYCQTSLTSGVGSCQPAVCTDPTTICCNTTNCNQIVTQCYNPAAKSFVSCDQTGLDTFCKLSFTGPLLSVNQLTQATGSCQTACTPSNTNDVNVVICCFAQNDCNNLFGPNNNSGHSGEQGHGHGVNGTGIHYGGKLEIRGNKYNKGKRSLRLVPAAQ
jgi:hypothetical protein